MAILVSVIRFVGSIKGIRNFKKLHDPKIYASEKGFISKKLYKTSPKFKNNRLSNTEFGGCSLAVKGIRLGLLQVIHEMVDAAVNERLMKFTRQLSLRDQDHEKGKRSICFSKYRSFMKSLEMNKNHNAYKAVMSAIRGSHSDSRTATTIEVTGLKMPMRVSPSGATHFRILSHMNVVSDYCYSETLQKYGPSNALDTLSTFAYSEIVELGSVLTAQIPAAFPEGTVLGEDCSVIHCLAIEFMEPNGAAGPKTIRGASLEIMDVF
jgi:hypothetical protein